MATKVVTFRLPEELVEAITSRAQAAGICKTAVVVEVLKQAFGFAPKKISPASSESVYNQQDVLLRKKVANLKELLVEFSQEEASDSNRCSLEELNQALAVSQALGDEVPQLGETHLPNGQLRVKPSYSEGEAQRQGLSPTAETHNTGAAVAQSESASGKGGGFEESLQQLAVKVEQRARMLEQVLSASVDHICMYDRLGRYTYANRAFMQSFELDGREVYGKTWQQLGLPLEFVNLFGAKLQIALTTGQSLAEEISLPTVNGVRDYEYILNPIQGADGSIEAVVYAARDITERKQAEESLRESEHNYRNLFEWAHDSIFITDASNHSLLDVNEHGARRLGYTRKQLFHLPTEIYSPPMDSKYQEAVYQQLWKTGSVTFEHVHECKNGKQIPVEISSRVVEYGGRLAIQSFVRDLTDRKRTEEKLMLYRQIITHFSEAIAIVDLQEHYIEQNPAHRLLLGYCDDELIGMTSASHLGEEVFAAIREELLNKGAYRGEVISRTKSGEEIAIELAMFVVCNDAGEPVCYVESKRDRSN